ncbi:hypothetical protein BATDEDRAFT_27038 [Batrachochytrium dendrobatidis JAM81]|uniref:Mitochondrial inner membrane protease subunit n=2 Tax=Batrachochytrium dendrobatidis TaxID=109871 RepID=F4P9G2_BATDJ|nr:uncharacterized protein BATDEDRAFT_27038 [Batrachochytrium dendrobatidis JAM81]EGF78397.1 hypothetical protein BATDEDRAFT_27038 [Batrachochytrium dendrobatidis JAM81]OAJ44583.1 signal peptidase I [Batrachochytrium dendrobatidis JEL423]|eukprot:XP_006681123.1 hypothetical protein BATDEDRAFT_27038 [Batrachochytrium dendrobatidis JAM81]
MALMVINTRVITIARIKGDSMSPTLNPLQSTSHQNTDDIVLVDLISPWLFPWRVCISNTIVLFTHPLNPDMTLVKRIQRVGDGIRHNTNTVHPNLQSQPHQPESTRQIIPQGHVWVEGDNPIKQQDSRVFGAVSAGLVFGKVLGVIWPLNRIGSNLNKH